MKNKQIFLILFLVVSVLSCKKEPDTPKYLKSYTTYMIPFNNGQASESGKYIWESKTFNSDSTVKHWDHRPTYDFDTLNNPLWSEENTYENGILKEKKISTTAFTTRYVYSYSNNRLQNMNIYNQDGLIEKYDYKYADSDNKEDTVYFYARNFDKPLMTFNPSYDANGNMIRDSVIYNSPNYEIVTWVYNSHNNMIKKTSYISENAQTSVQEIREYVYNTHGNISQCIFSFWPINYFQKYTYEYLDNGLISQISVYGSNTGIDGNYEQKGILKYEYNYAVK